MNGEMRTFRIWCQKVLPLVYDDSLSYYEVLCKVVKYINQLIETDKEVIKDIDELQNDMSEVQKWISNFDYDRIEEYITNLFGDIVKQVYFGLTDNGYFVAYIPEGWNDIIFGTTGLDTFVEGTDYGRLVLSY